MKIKRVLSILLAASLLATMFAGCGKVREEGFLDGKWAYIYETDKTSLKISPNGTAVLDGKKYDCEYDDEFICLKTSKGTQSLRYKKNGDEGIFLYKVTTYKYIGEGTPNGLVGTWEAIDNPNVSYEFTADGYFREDYYIPGYYLADEEAGTIFCMYNDHYEDTLIYYTLKDTELIIEYPWPMVKRSK